MNQKKITLTASLLILVLMLSACTPVEKTYTDVRDKENKDRRIVTTQTADKELSETFEFKYAPSQWKLEDWPAEEAPNLFALVHREVEGCVMLPGTFGRGLPEGWKGFDGTFFSSRAAGRTVDVYDEENQHVMHVVGYEFGESKIPYIFELRYPGIEEFNDQCYKDAGTILATFWVPAYTPAEETEETAEDESVPATEEAAE